MPPRPRSFFCCTGWAPRSPFAAPDGALPSPARPFCCSSSCRWHHSSAARGPGRPFQPLYLSLVGLMALFCAITTIGAWPGAEATAQATARQRDRGAVALSFIRVMPRNPELAYLSLHSTALNAQARILMSHGLLDVPFHSPLPTGSRRPPEIRIGGLQLKLRGTEGAIMVSGRSPIRHGGGRISHLLLTSIHGRRSERAFAVITPELSRHPPQAEYSADGSIRFLARAATPYLEPGFHVLKVWIHDASSGEYTPLVNEWEMHMDAEGLAVVDRERGGG